MEGKSLNAHFRLNESVTFPPQTGGAKSGKFSFLISMRKSWTDMNG